MFVSYAQNHEDVMLWRALKDIERGFYVDIGAWHPEEDSVTKAFYDRQWHGINVEPSTAYFRLLQASRPRDSNLKVAIASEAGSRTLAEFPDTGLSTLDQGIARQHERSGFKRKSCKVLTMTLAELFKQHLPPKQDIHFLKVDVEGYEQEVLTSNDWTSFRPWVLVVEATVPLSQEPSHESWAPMIEQTGYRFAYWDGLNRFYIADEHSELLSAFSSPPNVFDGYRSVREEKLTKRLTIIETNLQKTQEDNAVLEKHLSEEIERSQAALSDVSRLTQQLMELEEIRSRFLEQKDELKSRAAQLGEELRVAQEAVVSGKLQEAALEKQIVQQRNQWEKQRGSLVADKSKLQTHLDELTRKIAEGQRHQSALEERIEHAKFEALQLQSSLENQRCRTAQLEATMSGPISQPVIWLEHSMRKLNARLSNQSVTPSVQDPALQDSLAQEFLEAILKARQKA